MLSLSVTPALFYSTPACKPMFHNRSSEEPQHSKAAGGTGGYSPSFPYVLSIGAFLNLALIRKLV